MLIGGKERADQRRRAFLQIQEAVASFRRSYFLRGQAVAGWADPPSDAVFAALAKCNG